MLEPVAQKATSTLLEINDLRTHFHTDQGIVKAVDGVTLRLSRNRTLGVVGESGCGKSVMAMSVMRLLPEPPAKVEGDILWHGERGPINLAKVKRTGDTIRSIRGAEIAMIFQEPMTSLNPVYTVGQQIMEAIRLHQKVDRRAARELAIEMLGRVGIPSPAQRVDAYPHQMSGGMRQRVMIAMALSCHPSLLIADEPTTALDVTIQAQIIELMLELQEQYAMSIMMITHDLGVVAGMVDDVVVMYLGQIVESGPVRELFKTPLHPYTQGLLRSIPILGERRRLVPIPGTVPDPRAMPQGCRFAPRCSARMPICSEPPPNFEPQEGHSVRCWLYESTKETGGGADEPAGA